MTIQIVQSTVKNHNFGQASEWIKNVCMDMDKRTSGHTIKHVCTCSCRCTCTLAFQPTNVPKWNWNETTRTLHAHTSICHIKYMNSIWWWNIVDVFFRFISTNPYPHPRPFVDIFRLASKRMVVFCRSLPVPCSHFVYVHLWVYRAGISLREHTYVYTYNIHIDIDAWVCVRTCMWLCVYICVQKNEFFPHKRNT